jgi:hypothetical protein
MKKRSKAHIPRTGENIKLKMQPWKVKAVFDPLYAIIDELEQDGTVNIESTTGNAIFKDPIEGQWHDMYAALMGVLDAYEIHEKRVGRVLAMEPLRQLADKLKNGDELYEEDTVAVRACLARMRAETLEMTAGYARDLVKDMQLQEEMLKVAA